MVTGKVAGDIEGGGSEERGGGRRARPVGVARGELRRVEPGAGRSAEERTGGDVVGSTHAHGGGAAEADGAAGGTQLDAIAVNRGEHQCTARIHNRGTVINLTAQVERATRSCNCPSREPVATHVGRAALIREADRAGEVAGVVLRADVGVAEGSRTANATSVVRRGAPVTNHTPGGSDDDVAGECRVAALVNETAAV